MTGHSERSEESAFACGFAALYHYRVILRNTTLDCPCYNYHPFKKNCRDFSPRLAGAQNDRGGWESNSGR